MVEYPASSTYVIGAGGTTLVTNADGRWNNEIGWYAGGGGLSQFEAFWILASRPSIRSRRSGKGLRT